jgi:hypothetical protein
MSWSTCRLLAVVWWIGLGLGGVANASAAPTSRALLIGINEYRAGTAQEDPEDQDAPKRGRRWRNLEGAVNDVETIAALLVGRYGFDARNVVVLRNQEATRDGILAAIRTHLIDAAARGDNVLFYFAGHGSQVRNSQSDEDDQFDETIVPVDANRGVFDIRDKELRSLFNDVIDKGARLTVILDSCHSTSAQRGLPSPLRLRSIERDERDIAAAMQIGPADARGDPADRGALVLAAAQEFERAAEVEDGLGMPHGLFSMALASVLRTAPVNEPARQLFLRIRGSMKAQGHVQEPSIEGSQERMEAGLFGGDAAPGSGSIVAAVREVRADGSIELLGGLALGLHPGSEMRRVVTGAEKGKSQVVARIQSVEALNRSIAKPVSGDVASVVPGDLFTLTSWVAPPDAYLRVLIPPALDAGGMRQAKEWIAATRAPVESKRMARWVVDPSEDSPTHVVHWDGSTWHMTWATGGQDLGRAPTRSAILDHLVGNPPLSLYVQVPPSVDLAKALAFDERSPIAVTSDPLQSQYVLAGALDGKTVRYCWMLPNATSTDTEGASPLPLRSDWYDSAVDESLRRGALQLAKVRGWLQLEPPPDDSFFPYTLHLRSVRTGQIHTADTVLENDSFDLVLQADPRRLAAAVERR